MLTYYVLYRDDQRAKPSGVFVVDEVKGHAVIWDHRQRAWSYNPDLAFRFLADFDNIDRFEPIDRSCMERIAGQVTGGVSLPDPEAIERVFQEVEQDQP
ncbi:hypothetical protein E1193_12015 [Micromonospora sp. KC606]|uniref:hypothetical protein n=1 Tax=Micromonospora sp. KC606 TaxID=2530379 RepID=UPI001051657F|nr:hypothetical protein [Micromonospora sp. KC606]TDC82379.1 hypothetical protein E1193_12015 [Micromonospora sp. KC606]